MVLLLKELNQLLCGKFIPLQQGGMTICKWSGTTGPTIYYITHICQSGRMLKWLLNRYMLRYHLVDDILWHSSAVLQVVIYTLNHCSLYVWTVTGRTYGSSIQRIETGVALTVTHNGPLWMFLLLCAKCGWVTPALLVGM